MVLLMTSVASNFLSLSLFFDTVKFRAKICASHQYMCLRVKYTNAYETNNLSEDKSNYHKTEEININHKQMTNIV